MTITTADAPARLVDEAGIRDVTARLADAATSRDFAGSRYRRAVDMRLGTE